MLIYEVNLLVRDDVAGEYLTWLKDHIGAMLRFDGFLHATLAADEVDDTDSRRYVVHYFLRDRESLEEYFTNHAAEMRRDGLERFPGMFTATRRVLGILGEFEHEAG